MRALPVPARVVLCAALLAGLSGGARGFDGQGVIITPRAGVLNLRTGDVDTAALPNRLEGGAFPAGVHVLVMDGPMDAARRAALQQAGVVLRGYLPYHAFLADLSDATPASVRAAGCVTWAGEYRREWKIEPELAAGSRVPASPERKALAAQGLAAVNVWVFSGVDAGDVVKRVAALDGGVVRGVEIVGGAPCVEAIVPKAALGALADAAAVQFIEEFPEYTLRNNSITRWVMQSNTTNVTPLYDHGLHGEGQIVGVIDGRIADQHCSFLDAAHPIGPTHRKILAYNTTSGYNLHGTHVAGTAVGDGGTTGDTRGIAYAAKLVYNIHPDTDEMSMYGRFELHASQGASVHTNSWGADWTRAYDGGCRGIDAAARDFEDSLICFAVSDGSIVTNPENAKNSLAVSASGEAPNQENWCFGGVGPTQDGRRKPEIMAPGCGIFSSSGSSGCGTTGLSGTSMACPAVAGAAALVRQYFTDGFYPSGAATSADAMVPSGQLLKAVLVNSARDMTGVADFPSVREGWGRLVADDALYFTGDARRLLVRDVRLNDPAALETGGVDSTRVTVEAGQPLKVTLSWADAPAEVNASFVPINDLNLRVVSPSGVEYLGNVFAGGASAPGGSADTLNNLEQVLVAAPEAGVWEVIVSGAEVNVGAQSFAWAVTGGVSPYTCDGDVNQDGNLDGFDVMCMEIAVGGGDCSVPNPDFNNDGNVDGFDVEAVERVVGGGECP